MYIVEIKFGYNRTTFLDLDRFIRAYWVDKLHLVLELFHKSPPYLDVITFKKGAEASSLLLALRAYGELTRKRQEGIEIPYPATTMSMPPEKMDIRRGVELAYAVDAHDFAMNPIGIITNKVHEELTKPNR